MYTLIVYAHTYSYNVLYLTHRYMLQALQKCQYDVKRIGDCFVTIWESDASLKMYSDYCSLYPKLV